MSNLELCFVLGAQDPEMDIIERLLSDLGLPYRYATKNGLRVHPGVMYDADPDDASGIRIECCSAGGVSHIDHHRPGDPGYAMPPAQYFEASSLGQVIALLARHGIEVSVTEEMKVAAAADHCVAAAYQGQCPGIALEALASQRAENIAKAVGCSVAEVHEAVARIAAYAETAPVIVIGGQPVKDLRGCFAVVPPGYSLEYLGLLEAAAKHGYAFLGCGADPAHADVPARPKLILSGTVSKEAVVTFLSENPLGLVDLYGVPERGYAGGYLS
jgi:hypothetical protein